MDGYFDDIQENGGDGSVYTGKCKEKSYADKRQTRKWKMSEGMNEEKAKT